jgi:hypothetical protein
MQKSGAAIAARAADDNHNERRSVRTALTAMLYPPGVR